MRSLAERLRAFEQKKARLADTEAKLKLAEKRSRLRRCIRIGDLATRAGLAGLSDEALYGAMLAAAREDETKRRRWSIEGAASLAAHRLETDDRRPVVLTFSVMQSGEAAATLRSGGFRYNRLLRHWEGLVDVPEAEALAERLGGVARPVAV